jgi:hypothetical protein
MQANVHEPSSFGLANRKARSRRWLMGMGLASFQAHAAAFFLFTGWEASAWQWVHTFAVLFVAILSFVPFGSVTATPRLLSRIGYGIGVTSAMLPLLVYANEVAAHMWGTIGSLVWTMAAIAWAFLPAWVTNWLVRLERACLIHPSPLTTGDLIAGVVACIPLSGLPFWLLYRLMYTDAAWLDVRRFQIDAVAEGVSAVLLVGWTAARLGLRRGNGGSP